VQTDDGVPHYLVAQHVAHAHGGALRVANRPGGGAVFTMLL
jgi:signal transduction histidine kinase